MVKSSYSEAFSHNWQPQINSFCWHYCLFIELPKDHKANFSSLQRNPTPVIWEHMHTSSRIFPPEHNKYLFKSVHLPPQHSASICFCLYGTFFLLPAPNAKQSRLLPICHPSSSASSPAYLPPLGSHCGSTATLPAFLVCRGFFRLQAPQDGNSAQLSISRSTS